MPDHRNKEPPLAVAPARRFTNGGGGGGNDGLAVGVIITSAVSPASGGGGDNTNGRRGRSAETMTASGKEGRSHGIIRG